MESQDDRPKEPTSKGSAKQQKETTGESLRKRNADVQRETEDRELEPKSGKINLSKRDLLQLLGIMEGEVQAREDFINLMSSATSGPEKLESRYGWPVPAKVQWALQRDDGVFARRGCLADDVYKTPMAQLERLEDKQRETYRRMLEQLLLAEKCHHRTVMELDSEKSKHADFINKSDDFTNLLEQERERLKQLLEQKEAHQAQKDKEHSRQLEKLQVQLLKLKSFALMLVDERETHAERLDLQSQKVRELAQQLRDKEQRLADVTDVANRDGLKVFEMEEELEHRTATSKLEQEAMTAKLSDQESQSQQLRLKLDQLANRMEELQKSNRQRSDEDLQRDECRDSSPAAELEILRKKVLELEGQHEEISERRELAMRLRHEENISKELRLEVDKLQRRMADMEKLEEAFGTSRMECLQLCAKLEKEKQVASDLEGDLEKLKRRLKGLESLEAKLERAEIILKDDLAKLKSLTVILVDERKNMAKRLKQEEEQREALSCKLKAEECKVSQVTEKLIDESKNVLRLKSEAEVKVTRVSEENEHLKCQLRTERERCCQLNTDMCAMKATMDETQKMQTGQEGQLKDLAEETENLSSRLVRLEVVESDLMKTEDLAKSSDLEAPLKEKIHQLMATEDRLSQLQADYSVLQQRFLEEEEGRKSASQEAADLRRELEVGRRYARISRPGVNIGRTAEARLASTATQTDAPPAASADDFIRQSVLEEKHLMTQLRQHELKKPAFRERHLPGIAEPEAIGIGTTPSRGHAPQVSVSQKPGQPLHIRVTPNPNNRTATLEITGPRARDFFSSSTVIPTLGLRPPHITIVPKITAIAAKGKPRNVADPVHSPVTITTISTSTSPDKSDSRPAPLSIVTVSTGPAARASPKLLPEPLRGDTGGSTAGPDQRSGAASAALVNCNVVTTEDRKIHIRLKTTDRQDRERVQPLSARSKTEGGKMSSSLSITPVVAATCRSMTSVGRVRPQL
ncbi:filamin-A-interacting protein 1-like [Syngnathus typhle]|uniref:filamin-A-interacting protein 1-like n=1 Tax=Syngnathus typhle TaxID=161592 RepID=UPI002A6B2870|nr:filamin-A-interacting protein 1-like [Syngnathus typhle]